MLKKSDKLVVHHDKIDKRHQTKKGLYVKQLLLKSVFLTYFVHISIINILQDLS